MSNTNDNFNGPLPLTINGRPNIANPRAIACLLDLLGRTLTPIFNTMLSDPNSGLTTTERQTLIAAHHTLKEMRLACVMLDLSLEADQSHLTQQMQSECKVYEDRVDREILANVDDLRLRAQMEGIDLKEFDQLVGEIQSRMGIEKPSASDAADAILNDLRETGAIGGARAV